MSDLPISRAAEGRRRFLTVAQTAALLGLSHSTLQRAIRDGDFPAIKVRGRYVVPAKALDEMEDAALETGLVDTAHYSAARYPGLPTESSGAPADTITRRR